MKGLIFTYLLTYGGSLVALVNPFIGLLVYVCFSIIRPEALWFYSVPPGHYSRIIAVAMIVGWVFNGFGHWKFGRERVLLVLFVGFWLWMFPSTLLATHQEASWVYVENTLKILIPFFIGLTVIHSLVQVKQLLWVMIASVGLIAWEMNVSYFSGYNQAAYDGFGPLDNNGLGLLMVMGFGLVFSVVNGSTYSLGEKISGWTILLLIVHTILFSFSRGSMLSLVITAGVMFAFKKKQPHHYLIFAMILIVGVSLAGVEIRSRFETIFNDLEERDVSAQSRLDLWVDCINVMLHNPFFGVGPANWQYLASEYGWENMKAAHTTWLQVGAEMGLPGLLFISCFYAFSLKQIWPLLRGKCEGMGSFPQELAQAVFGALVGFIIGAQFVSLINLEMPYYIVLLGVLVLKITSGNQSYEIKVRDSVRDVFPTGPYNEKGKVFQ